MILFLLGIPFGWWIAIFAILFIIDIVFFAVERYGWSVFVMTISIIAAIWLDQHSTSPWLKQHSHQLIFYILTYILLGLGTAFLKWVLYVGRRVRSIAEAKTQFDKTKFNPQPPDFKQEATDEILTSRTRANARSSFKPTLVNTTPEDTPYDYSKERTLIEERTAELQTKWNDSLPAKNVKNLLNSTKAVLLVAISGHTSPIKFMKLIMMKRLLSLTH